MDPREIGIDFFSRNTLDVAMGLLGKEITYRGCSGVIVETEAYRDDPASHYLQRPNKAQMLKNTFGHIYVFLIYGMYFCLNFTTERDGIGAVLIRALEPTGGIEAMKQRRKVEHLRQIANGPGKLCQAFNIGMELHGRPVGSPLKVFQRIDSPLIQRSQRIGISKAKELEWRFFVSGNPFVSRR
jgi:DNA-3-methyladenine glycosylase